MVLTALGLGGIVGAMKEGRLIASTMAIFGLGVAPLSALIVAGTLAAACALVIVVDTVKLPVFARFGIT